MWTKAVLIKFDVLTWNMSGNT